MSVSDREKRQISVNVRMTENDVELLEQAAAILWKDAVMSRSSMAISMIRLTARQVIEDQRKKPKK